MHISVQPQEVSAEKKKDMKVKSRSEGRRLYSAKSGMCESLVLSYYATIIPTNVLCSNLKSFVINFSI